MGRRGGTRRQPIGKPVEKVEISERHIGRRVIAAALFLLVGAASFAYFFVNLVRGDTGWTQITASSSEPTCGGDFTFLYEVGAEGGALKEKRAVTAAYTEAARRAYQLFENVPVEEAGDKEPGVGYLNAHPNETVVVDGALYEAFSKLEEADCRLLYLPAAYEVYNNLFASASDLVAAEFDPRENKELASYFAEALAYANDPAAVDVELLGDNRVRLSVSEDYLAFAQANEIGSFIDFYWMKNAFVADFLAEAMTEAGFTHGSISSHDGFVRNLDGREIDYAFGIYGRDGEEGSRILKLADLKYRGPCSLVWLKDFPLGDSDRKYYYQMADGQARTLYIDPRDGLCRSAADSLMAYSYGEGANCADVLLAALPVYMADVLSESALEALAGQEGGAVYSVFRKGNQIFSNDPRAEFEELAPGYTLSQNTASVMRSLRCFSARY